MGSVMGGPYPMQIIDDRSFATGVSRIAWMPLPPGFVDELAAAVGEAYVLTAAEDLATYDCDGLTGWRAQPACVVLPGSVEDVQAVLRRCAREEGPSVARGAAEW